MIQKLLSTTAFRLSLIYAMLFSLIAASALLLVYWLAAQQIRQQTDDRLQLETNVLLSRYYSGTLADLVRMVEHRVHEDSSRFFVYALTHYQPENKPEDTSTKQADKPVFNPALSRHDIKANNLPAPVFTTLPLKAVVSSVSDTQKNLDTRVLITPLPDHRQLLVGSDVGEQEKLLNQLSKVLLIAVLITLVAAITGGIWLGTKSLKHVEGIRRKAEEIINGDLSQRMPVRHGASGLLGHYPMDEYGKLSLVINNMLDRLEILMHNTRNTTNNLAHDLRNPLNRLRHRLENLRDKNKDEEQTLELENAVEDVDRLVTTFNAILNIAQVEANVQREHWEVIDISSMIEDLGEIYSVVAEEKHIQFQIKTESGLQLTTERQLLAQAITNLLDNAIKYTPQGGLISLQAYTLQKPPHAQAQLVIRITDNGPGIPVADRERIFQPLTRLDNARSQPGNGLGLSLVKAIMDLHKGSHINVLDNQPGLMIKLVFKQAVS